MHPNMEQDYVYLEVPTKSEKFFLELEDLLRNDYDCKKLLNKYSKPEYIERTIVNIKYIIESPYKFSNTYKLHINDEEFKFKTLEELDKFAERKNRLQVLE
jgi:hypothetical protein